MATTPEVLTSMKQSRGVSYPVLVPNVRGLENLLQIHGASSSPIVDEIAIFTAASDSFNKANTNKTVEESLHELQKVVSLAKEKGLRVRGYVSTVITCPFEGSVQPTRVREVGKELLDMGCYEVSLGDTVGTGTEMTVRALMEEVGRSLPMDKLAVRYCSLNQVN
jgi:hydroxymethylglutaryl-CoA lyase